MIVYGDPEFTESFAGLQRRLRGQAATASSLDQVRSLLIAAGQLEQGLADLNSCSSTNSSSGEQAMVLTDVAAKLFLQTLRNEAPDASEFLNVLDRIESPAKAVPIKVPEGFAFYALYPEQYEVAARRWSENRRSSTRTVLVAGIRSIGTTLSAVVAETLRTEGWRVRRVTARPRGHPYDRVVP